MELNIDTSAPSKPSHTKDTPSSSRGKGNPKASASKTSKWKSKRKQQKDDIHAASNDPGHGPSTASQQQPPHNDDHQQHQQHDQDASSHDPAVPANTGRKHRGGRAFGQFTSNVLQERVSVPKMDDVQQDTNKLFSGSKMSDLPASKRLIRRLEACGYNQLTHIQRASWDPIMSGSDVMLKAETGSGKTLAFVIPLLQQLQALPVQRSQGVYALILVPTRELALQSLDVVQRVGRAFHWMVPGCVMGGNKRKNDKQALKKGINILIATPGRILDYLRTYKDKFRVDNLRYIVFDEADRLLDLGFEHDLHDIHQELTQELPHRPQHILISATLAPGVQRLRHVSLDHPVTIGFDDDDTQDDALHKFTVPAGLKQYYIQVPAKLRLVTLTAFLRWKMQDTATSRKAVVFVASIDETEFLSRILGSISLPALEDAPLLDVPLFKLHGNLPQRDRTAVFFEFCSAATGVLVTTDVAARGLDLPAVDWIVQYDSPGDTESYLHRAGRTARIGSTGEAVVFLMPHETEYLSLLREYRLALHEIPLTRALQALIIAFARQPKSPLEAASWLQRLFDSRVAKDHELHHRARLAYLSFLRSYAVHPRSLKHIFNVRRLHLGHVAASFALRDSPSALSEGQQEYGRDGDIRGEAEYDDTDDVDDGYHDYHDDVTDSTHYEHDHDGRDGTRPRRRKPTPKERMAAYKEYQASGRVQSGRRLISQTLGEFRQRKQNRTAMDDDGPSPSRKDARDRRNNNNNNNNDNDNDGSMEDNQPSFPNSQTNHENNIRITKQDNNDNDNDDDTGQADFFDHREQFLAKAAQGSLKTKEIPSIASGVEGKRLSGSEMLRNPFGRRDINAVSEFGAGPSIGAQLKRRRGTDSNAGGAPQGKRKRKN